MTSETQQMPLADALASARIGFGAMQLAVPGRRLDEQQAQAVLRRAVSLGVRHIDTSDAYGPHVANDLIRQALHPYPAEVLIATKVGVARDDSGAWTPAATPAALRAQVAENQRRLQRDVLDLVCLRVGGDGLLVALLRTFDRKPHQAAIW